MRSVLDVFALLEGSRGDDEFLPTGFAGLDEELDGGFATKELVVIGADTGVGKSAIAGQLFFNMAEANKNVAYFSLEMSDEMVVARLLGALGNIKPTRIRYGLLDFDEQQEKLNAKAVLQGMADNMAFYDDLYDLRAIITEVQKHSYDFVVVDFIQNVMIPGMDEYARLSRAALEFQKLAKEKNCCVLLLSQLSNTAAKGDPDGRVEYKGSGSIATVADLAFLLQRETNPLTMEDRLKLMLKKNRRGASRITFDLIQKMPGGWIREASYAKA